MQGCRWWRLEQYARHKRGSFLLRLPTDILDLIVHLLCENDVLNLVEALVPCSVSNTFDIPSHIRFRWAYSFVSYHFRAYIHAHADEILFAVREETESASLLINWSCFSTTVSKPIVEYAWINNKAKVFIHDDVLYEAFNNACYNYLPIVRLTVHRVSWVAGKSYIHPNEYRNSAYELVPITLIRLLSQ